MLREEKSCCEEVKWRIGRAGLSGGEPRREERCWGLRGDAASHGQVSTLVDGVPLRRAGQRLDGRDTAKTVRDILKQKLLGGPGVLGTGSAVAEPNRSL